MKVKCSLLAAVLSLTLLSGCTTTLKPPASTTTSPIASIAPSVLPSGAVTVSPTASPNTSPGTSAGASQKPADSVTSASIVNTAEAFQKAISKDGTWIICLLNDLTIDKDLTVDGQFNNKKTPPASQRKLAFYAQDENRTVTARYTLTAPKLTINSPDCAIWYGTYRGDLYVTAKNFQLIGATVDGNVYFTNADAKNTFKMDADSKITGVQQIKT